MASTAEQVRNIVLSKLEMLQIDYPADLEVSLLEVEQAILNYCNISEVPTELRFVWANMVVDYYRWIAEMATIAEATTPAKSSSPTVLSSIKILMIPSMPTSSSIILSALFRGAKNLFISYPSLHLTF